MLKDFVTNTAFLVAAFSLMGQIFKNRPLTLAAPLSTKLYWGLSFGLLGNILMVFSIHISTNIIADLRHIAIIIAAIFGGFIPALLASLLIAIGRIVFFDFNQAALLPSFGALLTGIVCGLISKFRYHPSAKAVVMNLFGLLIISFIFFLRIHDLQVLKNVLVVHYTFSLIGGFIAYHFLEYVAKSNQAQRELEISVIKLKQSEQKLHKANVLLNRLSFMDGLTGIANRRYFDQTLETDWVKSISTNSPISLLMFDIDYFKKYNDTYGHLSGDFCLQSIAQAIQDLFPSDLNYTFCRYGGEEFALILPAAVETEGKRIAHLILDTVQSLKIAHSSSEIANIVTISIGIATMVPNSLSNANELIQKADTALYLSKTKGRNTVSSLR
ncbi:GGDEF domain-containing protein [Paenibacillus sp. BSR1-1]|uniref:GGDEF domain-containing protein n=1 Tax=Paenibacillus sp. BSR1-1 TaxID=3020845 RepID=UPI0025AF89B3|nr:diguanylate cyclase [Paenibacillus sp. BSR1-1]MDN3018850.1 GGDEF domain-containing protein [Paenibacillus sp. BSR1-1]